MDVLFTQIKECLARGLYFPALYTTLTLPDICGALGSENGKTSGDKYKAWFDEYVSQKYNGFVNGETCYFLRCSLLHQGTSIHPSGNYSRILFTLPNPQNNTFHNNVLNDALNLDLKIFCLDIISVADSWVAENKNTELFILNYDKFLRLYPFGISPYMAGMPLIS